MSANGRNGVILVGLLLLSVLLYAVFGPDGPRDACIAAYETQHGPAAEGYQGRGSRYGSGVFTVRLTTGRTRITCTVDHANDRWTVRDIIAVP